MRCARFATALAATLALFSGTLRAQVWQLDRTFAPAAYVEQVPVATVFTPLPDGRLLAHGSFSHLNGAATSVLVRLTATGMVDSTFRSDLALADNLVTVAPLSEGRVIAVVGTSAQTPYPAGPLGGRTAPELLSVGVRIVPLDPLIIPANPSSFVAARLIRLRADGTRDPAFAALTCDGVPHLTALPDGRLLVWGFFRTIGGMSCNGLARLHADGTLDREFNPIISSDALNVVSVAPTSFGGCVISGWSVAADRISRGLGGDVSDIATYYLTRLDARGVIDPQFAPVGIGTPFRQLAVQPDGAVLAGNVGLARYSARGAVDANYIARIPSAAPIARLAPLAGGRVVVEARDSSTGTLGVYILGAGGELEEDIRQLSGAREAQGLRAVLHDGRLLLLAQDSHEKPTLVTTGARAGAVTPFDVTFSQRSEATISRLDVDAAGRVLVSGSFTHISGQPRAGLARFFADGTLDAGFNPPVGALLFVPLDGRAILSGPRRLAEDGSIDPSFSFPPGIDSQRVQWLASASDGRLLVSAFEPDNRRERNLKLIWLGPDGRRLSTLPTTFTNFTLFIVTTGGIPPEGLGVPNVINSARLLPDDQLLVSGAFLTVNDSRVGSIVRLTRDGAIAPATAPDAAIAFTLSDGSTVFRQNFVEGNFTTESQLARRRVDGTLDAAFQPPPETINGSAHLLADGSFFSGGRHFTADGWPNPNFTAQFRHGNRTESPTSAVLTVRGELWVGGSFNQIDEHPIAGGLARFVPVETKGIIAQPRSQTVVAGRSAYLQVAVGIRESAHYQWTRDGEALPNATTANLRLKEMSPSQAGTYRAIVTVGGATFTSEPALISVTPNNARLVNLSALSHVTPAHAQTIGIACTGNLPRPVVVRAFGRGGPVSLWPVELPSPVLSFFEGTTRLTQDRGGITAPEVAVPAAAAGAFPVNSNLSLVQFGGSLGAALIPVIAAGNYTAVTTSGDQTGGLCLAEFYDTGSLSMPPLVRNFSVQGRTAPGERVLTAGFVVAGDGPLRVLIRGIGPGLTRFGVAEALTDPRLELFAPRRVSPVTSNAGWADSTELAQTARRTGAFGLAPASRDAALVATLEPGAYTVQLASTSSATGTAMIEIYVVD